MKASRLQTLEEICRGHGVSILYGFGSRGREVRDWIEERADVLAAEGADVDIAVRPMPGSHWTVTDKVALTEALEDFLDYDHVDLVFLPETDPFVAAEAVRGERLYAFDELMADEYDLYALRRAGDLAPLERARLDLVLEEQA